MEKLEQTKEINEESSNEINDLITKTEGKGTLTILHALQQLLIQKHIPLFLQKGAGTSQ